MAELNFDNIKEKSQAAAQLKLQAIFYSVTALSSAAYIAYVLVYYDLLKVALGKSHEDWALLILAGSMLLEALLEIPTGALADRYGHHRSVLWSFVSLTIHALFYLIATLFTIGNGDSVNWAACSFIIISECLLALGTAFQTGSLHSWFVTSMNHEGYQGLYHVFMGRRRLTTNLIWLVVGIFVLLLKGHGNYRFTLSFTVSVVAYVTAAIVTRKLVKAKDSKVSKKGRFSMSELYSLMQDEFYGAVREILNNRKLTIVTISHAIYWTLAVVLTYSWQEILIPTNGQEHAPLGAQMTLKFAVTWIIISLARVLGSELTKHIKIASAGARDSRVIYFIIGQLILGLPVLFIFWYGQHPIYWEVLTVGAILLGISRVGQEFSKPITMAWTHEEVKLDRFRATVDSVVEAAAGFVIVLITVPVMVLSKKISSGSSSIAGERVLMVVIVVLSCSTIFLNAPLAWLMTRRVK
jgi:MFS family permease